jgi:twitching motility protein PilT
MIDYVNARRAEHIMTIEDPVEFVYENDKSLINQRELGQDTHSFAQALKHVLRQDPGRDSRWRDARSGNDLAGDHRR